MLCSVSSPGCNRVRLPHDTINVIERNDGEVKRWRYGAYFKLRTPRI